MSDSTEIQIIATPKDGGEPVTLTYHLTISNLKPGSVHVDKNYVVVFTPGFGPIAAVEHYLRPRSDYDVKVFANGKELRQ